MLQYGFPDDGLRKPKHVGANVIILNDFNGLKIKIICVH